MALTPLDIVARAHHRLQAREALVATQQVRRQMTGIDLRQPRQVGLAVNQLAPTLLQRRAASIRRAQTYYNDAREVAGFGRLPLAPASQEWAEEKLRSSLYITARGRLEKRADERSYAKAYDMAVDEMAGVGVRWTLDGGREEIIDIVKRDEVAVGFVRVTAQDSKVCYFCAMLASREDFKATSFDKSDPRFAIGGNPLANAKVHDRCRCSLQAIFRGEATPDHTLRARTLWYDLSEGDGREALRSFRRNYTALLRSGAPVWQAA